MATTLTNLIDAVRRRLGDHIQEGYDTADGDGAMDRFALTHTNIVPVSLTVTVSGAATTALAIEEESGWVTFTNPPANAAPITFSYQYTVWSDVQVKEAINVGIEELFGNFYVDGTNDDIWSEGGAEFIAQNSAGTDLSPEDRVTKVEYWNGSRWVKLEGWHVMTQNATKVIIFENTPTTGLNFRISYHSRPSLLTNVSDTLETTSGVPARAKEPVIDYACSELISARIAMGIRDDRAHNTQNENRIKSYEVVNDASYFRAQAERKASKLRMAPLKGRVAP